MIRNRPRMPLKDDLVAACEAELQRLSSIVKCDECTHCQSQGKEERTLGSVQQSMDFLVQILSFSYRELQGSYDEVSASQVLQYWFTSAALKAIIEHTNDKAVLLESIIKAAKRSYGHAPLCWIDVACAIDDQIEVGETIELSADANDFEACETVMRLERLVSVETSIKQQMEILGRAISYRGSNLRVVTDGTKTLLHNILNAKDVDAARIVEDLNQACRRIRSVVDGEYAPEFLAPDHPDMTQVKDPLGTYIAWLESVDYYLVGERRVRARVEKILPEVRELASSDNSVWRGVCEMPWRVQALITKEHSYVCAGDEGPNWYEVKHHFDQLEQQNIAVHKRLEMVRGR